MVATHKTLESLDAADNDILLVLPFSPAMKTSGGDKYIERLCDTMMSARHGGRKCQSARDARMHERFHHMITQSIM